MTASHIGNTGVNDVDPESDRVWVSGFVVRDLSRVASNWRSQNDLNHYLSESGTPGLAGIDTRVLVRHLRTHGAMKCVISTDGSSDEGAGEGVAGMGSNGRTRIGYRGDL